MAPTKLAEQTRRAAERGCVESLSALGLWYLEGKQGLEQDDVKGMELIRTAADHGDEFAQSYLGGCYAVGRIVEKNYALAAEWGRKAADQGNVVGQFCVGQLYALGALGVKKDLPWGRGTWSSAPRRATRMLSHS
jgi:TPR repeat protein